MTHKDLWNSIYSKLTQSLPTHAINTWFEPIVPIALTDNELVLEVPSQFFYEWIESHYMLSLSQTIQDVYNKDLKTRFIISAEKIKLNTATPGRHPTEKTNIQPVPALNKNYSFESFIEGPNNQFAKIAAETVAGDPGKNSFNPLIIYGGVGLGKTHLLHAIGNTIRLNSPSSNIVLATSERFTLDFVNSLRKNKTVEFAK
ncbi:MAG TPA: hypothetical protein EYG21_08770, partial [Nitrospinaceae bacterium]|nr:hypothetical protein [Nitrospinaceae bacterium]